METLRHRTLIVQVNARAFRAANKRLRFLGWTFRHRQPHLEACVAGLGRDLNGPPVLLHDSLNRVEAKPCALPNSFGGEERFKDMRLDLRRNSRTVVADLNNSATVFAIGSHAKFASAPHRIDGVIDDVGPNLIQLAPEGIHE